MDPACSGFCQNISLKVRIFSKRVQSIEFSKRVYGVYSLKVRFKTPHTICQVLCFFFPFFFPFASANPGQGICTPLLRKLRADMQRNLLEEEEEEENKESVNRLHPHYSRGVSSPSRHVRTRLYFTSESHIHSLVSILRYGGLVDVSRLLIFFFKEAWSRGREPLVNFFCIVSYKGSASN